VKTTKESFDELHKAVGKLVREIRDSIGYVLCELAFRYQIDDDIFNDDLNVKKECPFWIKFRVWFFGKCYHYGCWFYS
jgi:hypothetical protein